MCTCGLVKGIHIDKGKSKERVPDTGRICGTFNHGGEAQGRAGRSGQPCRQAQVLIFRNQKYYVWIGNC